MSFLVQDQVSSIFQKLEQFLRKVGNLEIFDTLVYNYRLRPELQNSTLHEFTSTFYEFLNALKSVQTAPAPGTAPGAPAPARNKPNPKKKVPKKPSSSTAPAGAAPAPAPSIFHCDLCPGDPELKFFSSVKDLNSHKISFHPGQIPSFPCNLCPESFRYSSSLAKHKQRKHRNQEDIYRCDSCPGTFPKRISLTNHKFKAHGILPERKFPCKICGNGYSTPNSLRTHIHSHHRAGAPGAAGATTGATGAAAPIANPNASQIPVDKLKCTICPKIFARKDKLDLHLLTHSGDKPFVCEKCGKSFNRKSKLVHHNLRIHEEEKEKHFKCTVEGCGKAYALNVDLKIHVKKKHGPKSAPVIRNGQIGTAPAPKKRPGPRPQTAPAPASRISISSLPPIAMADPGPEMEPLPLELEQEDLKFNINVSPPGPPAPVQLPPFSSASIRNSMDNSQQPIVRFHNFYDSHSSPYDQQQQSLPQHQPPQQLLMDPNYFNPQQSVPGTLNYDHGIPIQDPHSELDLYGQWNMDPHPRAPVPGSRDWMIDESQIVNGHLGYNNQNFSSHQSLPQSHQLHHQNYGHNMVNGHTGHAGNYSNNGLVEMEMDLESSSSASAYANPNMQYNNNNSSNSESSYHPY